MGQQLRHRGPDGDGYLLDGPVGLAHRRLSIIDLSGGAQPITNEDHTIHVVFNGEIYNYSDLRASLIRRGHVFRTSSDTEVLVHLYEDAGEHMPEQLNGMFALAIWDSRRRELFLCRDRMGEKPLYYTTSLDGFRFAFASELKALSALPMWQGEVDERGVADFLALGYIPDPNTIYRGVSKLQAAHSLTITQDGLRLQRYWQAEFGEPRLDFTRAVEGLRSLTQDAVEKRMISDVPLGAFLSGGVDSTAVVGAMAASTSQPVRTFSIGFTDQKWDERAYARLASKRHRTDHHERVVTPSVEEAIDLLAWHFDEPFGDPSAIPMLYLARMTRRHVTVALSGDGADEIFGGYRRYRYGVLEQRLRGILPAWFRRSAVSAAGRWYPKADYLPRMFRAKTLLTNIASETGDAYFTSMSSFRDSGLDAVLAPEVRAALSGYSPRQDFRQRFQRWRHLDPLQQMQAVDLETHLPGDILVKTDRATMAFSIESRAPWLDHRLADVALGFPTGWKIRGRSGKCAFKNAVGHFVPDEILTRSKMGFSVPLASWLRTALRGTFETLVLSSDLDRLVNRLEVQRLWREHQSGLHNHDRKLWNLLMLAVWDQRRSRDRRELALATLED